MLRDLIRDAGPRSRAATIMAVTAEYFAVTLDELCGQSSSQVLSARQIAMYLCRELTDLTLPKIGQTFGGRDHTTVMHADRRSAPMAERRQTYDHVQSSPPGSAAGPRSDRRVVARMCTARGDSLWTTGGRSGG